jgi:hypothetical protein
MSQLIRTVQVIHAVNQTHQWHHMPVNDAQQPLVCRFVDLDALPFQSGERFQGFIRIV